ncbi:MAG: hypothetical protein LIO77_10995, partial [Rikenellaceae bacterium]|nr:hypothetical protein [Rikenellaceae bacterium]
FWNFEIQFFVGVLGVFVTLWVGNLTEKSKENKRSDQALRMIRQELVDYKNNIERKIPLLEQESLTYRDILLYTTGNREIPPADSLIHHIQTFRLYTQESVIHISLQSAEKSGALYNIKDLSLLESIYDSYEYVSLIYRLNNEKKQLEVAENY